jgi:hypothetical protein
MLRAKTRTALKYFLKVLSQSLFVIGGLSFFVGGLLIQEMTKIDRILAEFLGIGFALACLFVGLIAKSKIEDLDWEEENERALRETSASANEPRP